jgi:hypothetical protein
MEKQIGTTDKKSRQLNKEKVNLTSIKPIERFSLLLSLIAIGVSFAALYFQFFYEKIEVRTSFISSNFVNDSILISKILYHNKGNQYSTILRNEIVFYQNTKDIENKGIFFSKNAPKQVFEECFDPIVLLPGQQLFREIVQPFNFKNVNLKEIQIRVKDTIRIALVVGFINNDGLYSINNIPIGWLLLDTNLTMKYFSVEYKSAVLIGNTYRSNTYRIPK